MSLGAGGDKKHGANKKQEKCFSPPASPERVALVVVLQLVLVVLPQLPVPELPVHSPVLAHVNDVFVVVVIIVPAPQATSTDVDQLSLLEPTGGGAGTAAVGRGGRGAVGAVSAATPA